MNLCARFPYQPAIVLIIFAGLWPGDLAQGVNVKTVHVEPEEIQDLLPNPGMGWQTFQRFADRDNNLAGLPSTSAYFRFYWRELEPSEGKIDFEKCDGLLTSARKAGQKLAFRIMCTGSGEYMDVPRWLKDNGCRGTHFKYGGRDHWVPDFTDPKFQEAHFRLIRELGNRYDGHADLDLVDIGSIGLWGEWHISSTEALDTGKPVPLPPLATRLEIIDAWCAAFPKTPKVILIGSEEGMTQAVSRHYGWRADCLGDMGGFSRTWNHMTNLYPVQIARTGATDAWKQAPVAYESCWDMRKWKEAGWDIRRIFDYALETHASYVNNKSAPIPDGVRPEIERLLKRLGYRLVLRSLEHPARVQAGNSIRTLIQWDNIGVAPPYRDYRLAMKLARSNSLGGSASYILSSSESIRGWLPGARMTEVVFHLPKECTAGTYQVMLGVVSPGSSNPVVRLAIEGRDQEGWYAMSLLGVE